MKRFWALGIVGLVLTAGCGKRHGDDTSGPSGLPGVTGPKEVILTAPAGYRYRVSDKDRYDALTTQIETANTIRKEAGKRNDTEAYNKAVEDANRLGNERAKLVTKLND